MKFLSLIFITSITSYFAAIKISETNNKKVILLWVLLLNFGILFFFKYFGWFEDCLVELAFIFNQTYHKQAVQILLPVGVSFYTFQSMSYVIDVYRGQLKASRNFVECAGFISFFPQLVAGPIERATNLLPQIQKQRIFNYNDASDGLRYILWGVFKKMVIADNCAPIVNDIFDNCLDYSSPMLWYGTFLFAIQIYCDFSGYSEIAIGCGKLLGINFMTNFSFPYFSKNIKEFWQRWHISLSTWFKDYLYMPLGGSRFGKFITIRNVMLVFVFSGLWHGANFTFIVWGLYHALLYILYILVFEKSQLKIPPYISSIFTFICVCIGWVFFRAKDMSQAKLFIIKMFSIPEEFTLNLNYKVLFSLIILVIFEFWNSSNKFGLDIKPTISSQTIRWSIYILLIFIWVIYANFNEQTFIYFNF